MNNMQPIDFVGLDRFIRQQEQTHRKCGHKTDDDGEVGHPVLAGLATKYNQPFIHDRQIQMIEPFAFAETVATGKRVNLQVSHDSDTVAANTNTGLELLETDLGLIFRCDLRRVRNGSILARMVECGDRACASVGYKVVADRTETYAGQKVRVIAKAALTEISLCRLGAVPRAFVYLTDSVRTPTIKGMDESTLFALSSAVHRVGYTAKKTKMVELAQLRLDEPNRRGMSDTASEFVSTVGRIVGDLRRLRV